MTLGSSQIKIQPTQIKTWLRHCISKGIACLICGRKLKVLCYIPSYIITSKIIYVYEFHHDCVVGDRLVYLTHRWAALDVISEALTYSLEVAFAFYSDILKLLIAISLGNRRIKDAGDGLCSYMNRIEILK